MQLSEPSRQREHQSKGKSRHAANPKTIAPCHDLGRNLKKKKNSMRAKEKKSR
jgi:hypothetical protein